MFNPQSFTETTLSKTNSKSFWKMVCWKTVFFFGVRPYFQCVFAVSFGERAIFLHETLWGLEPWWHPQLWLSWYQNKCWAVIKTLVMCWFCCVYGILLPNYLPTQNPEILVICWFSCIKNGILITTQLYTQTLNDVWHICPHLVVFYGKCIGTYTIHGKFGIGCFNKPI